MTSEEIREIAIDSGITYHKYLEDNNKGIQIVDVFDIEYLQSKDFLIKLRLSAKLFDTESIFFKLLTTNKKYDTSEVKVIQYDSDKNILLVKIIPEKISEFSQLRQHDIKVISDLKFLVQRVKTWYEVNGSKIKIPENVSILSKTFSVMRFLNEKIPSENQKKSLKNIFTKPFSYVWGAPGTGKTQFVLAYAVLHYINNEKKVAIFAPTNNAIEQVLRGVIKMTDEAGIDRKKIIRLGTPSRKFAEAFPEVCEEKGVQKRLDEVDKQISILERIIIYGKNQNYIIQARQNLNSFENIKKLEIDVLNSNDIKKKALNEFRKNEIEDKYLLDEINNLNKKKETLKLTIDSISHKFKKVFSSKPTKSEVDLNNTKQIILTKLKDKDLLKYSLDDSRNNLNEKNNLVIDSVKILNEFIISIQNKFNLPEKIKEIISDLNSLNWNEIKIKIEEEIENQSSKLEIDTHLLTEYKNYSLSELQNKLELYFESRSKLALSSTEERLSSVNVIACTLDGYIGRYTDSKLNVEHIFLDEAGYANVIKALTLFNHGKPITFLGDHKQLPPVCEINDLIIEKEEEFKNMFIWAQSAIYLESLFNNTRNSVLFDYLKNVELKLISLSRTSLNSTFRFGENLAVILGRHVYDNSFKSENPEGETKILYINAKKKEELRSRLSSNEVESIKKLIEILKSKGRDEFVILTPYKKQVKLLGIHLPQERNDLKILTVHGSQGREWETVILSVVDTSDMWFVDSTQKLSNGLNLVNTAVSRAKKELIIVCDKGFWEGQKNQLITDLIIDGKELIV